MNLVCSKKIKASEQSLCKVPPTPVHPHVGFQSMDAFLFALYSPNSPVALVCGRLLSVFNEDIMQNRIRSRLT